MMLETFVAATRDAVATRRATWPIESLLAAATPSDRDFVAALTRPSPGFILEVKPRSPSAGALRTQADLAPILAAYRRHANAISVLTEARFFGGSLALLAEVRRSVPQPILAKDFVLDPYQVVEARVHGADAVLLMLSVLDDDRYRACAEMATRLRMGVLTEVHTAAEIDRAEALEARVIGINNRQLGDLSVDLGTTEQLAARAPGDAILIAESGIRGPGDVARLRPVVDGFLVGTALMAASDPSRAARALIFGPTKVCGLTRPDDARAAAAMGATHGGLIFAPGSPRVVSTAVAASVRTVDALGWVGVFLDQPIDMVTQKARDLALAAVQLHGSESDQYCAALRDRLVPETEIWKAVRVADRIPEVTASRVDRIVLDCYQDGMPGGTGRRFDWTLLGSLPTADRYVLSGGLGPDNAAAAQATGIRFLDVNSGVERAPGVKDADRLNAFFAARRAARRTVRCA